VVVQIPGGSYSASVCRVLQNAGAIDDAAAFDAYLVSRGIDRYIRSGTYYITAGSSYEEIAKLITGR
jgi:cell division protein YceG involved in septum cleavage